MQSTVCPVRSARCLSKSNMALAFAHDLIGKPLPTFPDHALTISVFAVEIAGDILANGRLARGEAGVIAGAAQVLDGALREILVLAARPSALNMAPIMSRKLSALPVPTLKMPLTEVASSSQRSTDMASST